MADKKADPELAKIHPLGKSPILTVERDGRDPLVLIESAAIVEYLCDYYGQWLIPQRYPEGKDGQVGQETEAFIRYRTFMHYAEGSIMPLNLIALLMSSKSLCESEVGNTDICQRSRILPCRSSSVLSSMVLQTRSPICF